MDESKSTRIHRFRLVLGEMQDLSGANQKSTAQLEEFQQSNSFRELLRIDGEPIEFEWNIFPGPTSLEILQKIQKDLQDQDIEPEKFRRTDYLHVNVH